MSTRKALSELEQAIESLNSRRASNVPDSRERFDHAAYRKQFEIALEEWGRERLQAFVEEVVSKPLSASTSPPP